MAISWITKDGRRIPLNSGASSNNNPTKRFDLSTFISLDAKCPECRQQVVFYQNSHGSRVFFNDAGWPWEKHECTDSQQRSAQTNGTSKKFGQSIMLPNGSQLEAVANGYLLGYYNENDDSESFALLRLKTPSAAILFVECAYRRNEVSWDVLHDVPFFLRMKSQVGQQNFPLWFFSSSANDTTPRLRMIEVNKTSIPFEECVRAFRRN